MSQKLSSLKEAVILLHGLGRSEKSMLLISHMLQKEKYHVVNIGYPSTAKSIRELAEQAVTQGLTECREYGAQKIHFVTHSMGGILVRQYLKEHDEPLLGRVVMLGTPNHGSEIVDKYRQLTFFRKLSGPAGLELGTRDDDAPKKLGAVTFELGVIAGSRSINPFLSLLLPGPGDGKVTVESAKVEGMSDFITLPTTHPTMLLSPQVIRQIKYFLRHGQFNPASATRISF